MVNCKLLMVNRESRLTINNLQLMIYDIQLIINNLQLLI